MKETEQGLDKYVGHLAEGALRFRNELSVGTDAPDFVLPAIEAASCVCPSFAASPTLC